MQFYAIFWNDRNAYAARDLVWSMLCYRGGVSRLSCLGWDWPLV